MEETVGFIIKYSRFFSVTFNEEGSDDPIPGFRFFPTHDCHRHLQNFNLVFRTSASGFAIYYSESPLIPISERTRFTFGFTISNAGLFEKYGLIKVNESDTTVYQPGLFFDNLKSDGAVITSTPSSIVASSTALSARVSDADTYKIYRQTFKVYDSSEGTPPTSYELKHKYESSLKQTVPVAPGAGGDTLITTINSVDLKEEYLDEPGPYLLEADVDPPHPRNVYLNNELGQKSAGGVIDIYWETAQNTVDDPETGLQYQVTFKPK